MPHGGARPPDLASLLAAVAELHARVEARDLVGVAVLCEREAHRLPREVREEAMAVARTPVDGHRAPLRLLLFWRAARVLARDAREHPADAAQLELDLCGGTRAASATPDRLRLLGLVPQDAG